MHHKSRYELCKMLALLCPLWNYQGVRDLDAITELTVRHRNWERTTWRVISLELAAWPSILPNHTVARVWVCCLVKVAHCDTLMRGLAWRWVEKALIFPHFVTRMQGRFNAAKRINILIINHHHHMSVMELGHLLTRSGLTYLEVSSEVCHDSFWQLGNSVSLSWVVCREAFCLHVVSSSTGIPAVYLEPVLFLIPLQCVNLFCNLPQVYPAVLLVSPNTKRQYEIT